MNEIPKETQYWVCFDLKKRKGFHQCSYTTKYLTFIHELKCAIKEKNPCYLPTFSMIYSYEKNKTQFAADNQKKSDNNNPFVKRAGLYLFFKSVLIEKNLFLCFGITNLDKNVEI